LTNLVDRPSIEQAELSRAEMVASVPTFLDKVRKWRPGMVCFVGRSMWLCVEKGLQMLCEPSALSPRPGTPKRPGKKGNKKNRNEGYGMQPYKIVHPSLDEHDAVEETLLFVVPSTSGRVVSHQLPDKVRLFTTLHNLVEQMKAGILNTDTFVTITLLKADEMPEVPPESLPASLLTMDDVKDEDAA